MKVWQEEMRSGFPGTIIDIETIGGFQNNYFDSRRFANIVPVIFGFITKDELTVYCAKKNDSIPMLHSKISELLEGLPRPFHAFNTHFETGSLYHQLGLEVKFDGELQKREREWKGDVVKELGIPQYNDPFNDRGFLCMKAWERGDIDNSIAHNRACLLKERDILLKRGFIKPKPLTFFKINKKT